MLEATVVELNKVLEKKGKQISLDEVDLVEGKGMFGDFYADGGNRQITLMTAEISNKIKQSLEEKPEGICLKRYKHNIKIDDIDSANLYVGKKIKLNDSVIEITETKGCFGEECPLVRENKECPIRDMGLFAKVVKSGKVTKNK